MGTGFDMVENQMSEQDFLREYTCNYEPSETQLRLEDIAKEYHDRCDSFDRVACRMTAPDGEPIVTEPGEQALINKNARDVLRQLQEQNGDITKQAIWEAIKRYEHESPSPSLYRAPQPRPQKVKYRESLEELEEPVI